MEGLPLLHQYLFEFEVLVNEELPEMGRNFQNQMLTPCMYASGWFMTDFSADLPLPLAVRIWDILVYEGAQKTVLQVGLELLRHFEDDLLKLPFEGLLQFLRCLPKESLDLDIICRIRLARNCVQPQAKPQPSHFDLHVAKSDYHEGRYGDLTGCEELPNVKF